jgi:uncharacterized protein YeaO (DUF488 family)
MLQIKRIYDDASKLDGYRILVDRLWPRGVSKEKAAIDRWYKEIAPSPELRNWFGHVPEKFTEFRQKYIQELQKNPTTPEFLKLLAAHKEATLLYAAKDPAVNHAVVLLEFCKNVKFDV